MSPADSGPGAPSPPGWVLKRNTTHVMTMKLKTGTLAGGGRPPPGRPPRWLSLVRLRAGQAGPRRARWLHGCCGEHQRGAGWARQLAGRLRGPAVSQRLLPDLAGGWSGRLFPDRAPGQPGSLADAVPPDRQPVPPGRGPLRRGGWRPAAALEEAGPVPLG